MNINEIEFELDNKYSIFARKTDDGIVIGLRDQYGQFVQTLTEVKPYKTLYGDNNHAFSINIYDEHSIDIPTQTHWVSRVDLE